MTDNPLHTPNTNTVSAGTASDVKTFVAAALLTFATGMIALMGLMMIGGFGVLLGIIGAIFGIVWWKNQHDGRIFPRDIPASGMWGLGVVALGLFALVAMMS